MRSLMRFGIATALLLIILNGCSFMVKFGSDNKELNSRMDQLENRVDELEKNQKKKFQVNL